MLDIRTELEAIDNGRWGYEIRFPIYSALEKIGLYFNYGIGNIIPDNEEEGGTEE